MALDPDCIRTFRNAEQLELGHSIGSMLLSW